jgi:hypothetical protein
VRNVSRLARLRYPGLCLGLCLGLLLAARVGADEPAPAPIESPPGEAAAAEEVPAGEELGAPEPRDALSEAMPDVYGEGHMQGFAEGIEHWQDQRPWRYGTQYLFPLTRGMDDAGIHGWVRFPVGALTVVLDTAHLPFGAVAGLFGS